jgi:spermidine synthase
VLGDGRLQVARAEQGAYGLMILDAFSSDAVPVHLLTREAVRVYLRALRPDGILAFHLSNRYLDLVRVADAWPRTRGSRAS